MCYDTKTFSVYSRISFFNLTGSDVTVENRSAKSDIVISL